MKAAVSILFAFLLLWQPATTASAGGSCGGEAAIACGGCCCCTTPNSEPSSPVAPVQSRPAANEQQLTLLLPTITASLLFEQSAQTSNLSSLAESSDSVGALPLFRRDCALLL